MYLIERFFKNKSINQANIISIVISGLFSMLLIVLMGYNSYSEYKKDIEDIKAGYLKSQKELIKRETDRALRYIRYKAEHRGKKSIKEIQKEIVDAIEYMRDERGGTGYIFIYTFDGINIADPILKQNAGKNMLDFQDPNGKKVIKELIEVSKRDGGGFVKYFWNKPIVNKLSPKISYARSYKPWRWMVGSGVYLDDIQKVLKKRQKEYAGRIVKYIFQIIGFAFIIFLVSMSVYRYVTHLITKDIAYIQKRFERVLKDYSPIDAKSIVFVEFQKIAKFANGMISQIKEKNRELKTLNEDLEKRVVKKTKMIRVEKNRAEKLLKMQDKFIKNAIHEINTPLSIILVNIELYNLKYTKNEYLTKIEAGVKIIHNIYNDLSYIVKKGLVEHKKKVINFSDFLKDRIDFFQDVAEGNSLKIVYEIEDGLMLFFNEIELQRVCDNNISNAIKYSFENSEIFVKAYKSNKKTVFSIQNNSEKIKDTYKLFDRFYREDDARGGFGLGLSIVGDICKENGVSIDVVSKNGKTEFRYIFDCHLKENYEDSVT